MENNSCEEKCLKAPLNQQWERKRLNSEKKSSMAGNNDNLTAPCPPKSQSQEAGPAPQPSFVHLFFPFHFPSDPTVSWNRE